MLSRLQRLGPVGSAIELFVGTCLLAFVAGTGPATDTASSLVLVGVLVVAVTLALAGSFGLHRGLRAILRRARGHSERPHAVVVMIAPAWLAASVGLVAHQLAGTWHVLQSYPGICSNVWGHQVPCDPAFVWWVVGAAVGVVLLLGAGVTALGRSAGSRLLAEGSSHLTQRGSVG